MWIVDHRVPRRSAARSPPSLFGNAAALLSDGTEPMAKVPAIRVGGGTAFAGDAIAIGAEPPRDGQPPPPARRLVVSDGGWYDTEAGVQKIRWLAELGVPTIHLSIGAEPLSVEASRICVLTDPADGLDAHRPAHRRRPHAPPIAARPRRRSPRLASRPASRLPAAPSGRSAPQRPKETPLTHDALLPEPALFDVTAVARRARRRHARARRARAPRARAQQAARHLDPSRSSTLAAMLARTGQLVPCIGYRPRPDEPRVVLCAGQRRLLAARASHELAGTPGFEGLAPGRAA